MEALLNSNADISKEDIIWAASHLPETSEKGEHSASHGHNFVYDHSQKNLYKAIGIDESDAEKTGKLLTVVTKKCALEDEYKLSHAIEEIMDKSQEIPGFFPLVLSKVLKDALEDLEQKHLGGAIPKELLKLLKEMKRKSEEGDDE